MKRTELKRKTPLRASCPTLKRGKPLPAKRAKGERRTTAVRDRAYLDAVKTLPCCASHLPGVDPCWGPIDPHHTTRHGAGVKGDDDKAIPLCRKHHGNVEDLSGPFKGWKRSARDAWYGVQVILTQGRLRR